VLADDVLDPGIQPGDLGAQDLVDRVQGLALLGLGLLGRAAGQIRLLVGPGPKPAKDLAQVGHRPVLAGRAALSRADQGVLDRLLQQGVAGIFQVGPGLSGLTSLGSLESLQRLQDPRRGDADRFPLEHIAEGLLGCPDGIFGDRRQVDPGHSGDHLPLGAPELLAQDERILAPGLQAVEDQDGGIRQMQGSEGGLVVLGVGAQARSVDDHQVPEQIGIYIQ